MLKRLLAEWRELNLALAAIDDPIGETLLDLDNRVRLLEDQYAQTHQSNSNTVGAAKS